MNDAPIPLRQNAHSYQMAPGRFGLTGLAVEEIPTTERVTPLGVRTGDVIFEAQSLYRVYTGLGLEGVNHATQVDVRVTLDAFLSGLRLDHVDISEFGEVVLYVSVTRSRPFSPVDILAEVTRIGAAQAAPAAPAPAVMPPPERPLIAPAPVHAQPQPVAAPAPRQAFAPPVPQQAIRTPQPVLRAPPVPGGFIPEGPTKVAEAVHPRPAALPQAMTNPDGSISDAEAARRVASWLDAPDTTGRVVDTEAPTAGVGLAPINPRLVTAATASGEGFASDLANHPRANMKC